MRTPTRILVVDDDPINVEVLRVRLSAQGYEVVTAIDGEEGLQRARELEPDLVLLDVMMPKLDGISVLKELKADITLRFMPVRDVEDGPTSRRNRLLRIERKSDFTRSAVELHALAFRASGGSDGLQGLFDELANRDCKIHDIIMQALMPRFASVAIHLWRKGGQISEVLAAV